MAETDTTTIIGRDATFKGELTFQSPARILGTVEGRVHAGAPLHIGESAQCRATVQGTQVRVEGLIEGDVIASERAELTSKARVKGDLTAGALVVAEGASFVGHCRVGPEAVQQVVREMGLREQVSPSRSAEAEQVVEELRPVVKPRAKGSEWGAVPPPPTFVPAGAGGWSMSNGNG